MARQGKIARLPSALRQKLNERLDNGDTGEVLLAWLNGLPEVRAILQQQFRGAPVNHVNLSAWRHGGHADWLKQRQDAAIARQFVAAGLKLGSSDQ